jgi:hypothetical protein
VLQGSASILTWNGIDKAAFQVGRTTKPCLCSLRTANKQTKGREVNVKRLITLFALVGALTASQCFAIPVLVQRLPGYYSGSGGEFNLDVLIGGPYASDVQVGGGFETFCSQKGINISVPGVYLTGALSPVGVAGVGFLYKAFVSGAMSGYDYTPGATRAADAGALQEAIWNLLGQVPNGALNAQALFYKGLAAGASGNYGVYMLPLTKADGESVQSMLVYEPHTTTIPDGGLTAMLLGFGLVGIYGFSRRSEA